MIRYLFWRLTSVVPVLLGVVTIVFLLIHLTPGDPVDMMLGESAMPAQQEELRHSLNLDAPLLSQYVSYLGGVVRFDLGTSISTSESVAERIERKFPATVFLSTVAMFIALMISLPAGLLSAWKNRTPVDGFVMSASLIGLAMPAFWLGPLLIILFSVHLKWFPLAGAEGWESIVLPSLTLGTGMAALLARMTRNSLIEVLHEDFIRTAKAKGLSERKIFLKHAFRNALLPIVTIAGLQTGALLAGSIITERVFSWPGIGSELLYAIEKRDYPLVQGCVLVIAISYVAVNLATDLIYGFIDPRVRVSKEDT